MFCVNEILLILSWIGAIMLGIGIHWAYTNFLVPFTL